MRNSMKVAKWEMKRNMKNKSFIISLFLTPIIFLIFSALPSILEKFNSEPDPPTVYIEDELEVWSEIRKLQQIQELNWKVELKDIADDAEESIDHVVFIQLNDTVLNEGKIPVYIGEDVDNDFIHQVKLLEEPLRQLQLSRLNLSDEEMALISKGVTMVEEQLTVHDISEVKEEGTGTDPFIRIVPGVFAGVILFSIVMTGMMIFQSASQEKKEKVAEIVLSSLTPEELMNGKVIGYFGLGIVQVFVWILFAIPIIIWRFDFPVMEYLLVPELLLLLLIAVAGYLLFAAIFVGIGATVEDMTATSNFQGMVMMLPFLPAVLISPVISDPSGTIAQIGSYFPLTSPAILIMRLSMLDEWPWVEIIISLVILALSIWLFMKLAGKIFKTGILLYGKNATPQEIWKWIKQ